MSRLQSCSRIFEKSSAVAEKKIPENRTFSEKSEKMRALSRHWLCMDSSTAARLYSMHCRVAVHRRVAPSWRRRSRQAIVACHRLVLLCCFYSRGCKDPLMVLLFLLVKSWIITKVNVLACLCSVSPFTISSQNKLFMIQYVDQQWLLISTEHLTVTVRLQLTL